MCHTATPGQESSELHVAGGWESKSPSMDAPLTLLPKDPPWAYLSSVFSAVAISRSLKRVRVGQVRVMLPPKLSQLPTVFSSGNFSLMWFVSLVTQMDFSSEYLLSLP